MLKLTGCEPCQHWRRTHCGIGKFGWPDAGKLMCKWFEREPGVEG